jgi:hypothetical protein
LAGERPGLRVVRERVGSMVGDAVLFGSDEMAWEVG